MTTDPSKTNSARDAASQNEPRTIAVLGAGVAGLRAAGQLLAQGHRVRVYEARDRIGGRVTGHWKEGHWMDACWPVLGGRDASLGAWASELGLGDAVWPLRPVQTTLMQAGTAEPVDGSNLSGAARIPGVSWLTRAKLLRFPRLADRYAPLLDPSRPERAASLDYRSVEDHVALYFGRSALEFWLTPEIQSSYGDHVEELSRVALLQHCHRIGVADRRPSGSGIPRRPLSEVIEAAGDRLEIALSTAVERVDEEPSGGFRVETTNGSANRNEDLFDSVVIALGPESAAQVCSSMLTPAERDFFAAMETREVVTLAVALDEVDTGLPSEIRVPSRDGSAIASMLVEPGQAYGRAPEGATQMTVLARDAFAARWSEMADDVVAKNLLSSLEVALPGVGNRLKSTLLGRASVPFFAVGAYRRLETFRKVQTDRRSLGRRLYWAGDYLAGPSFESASLSGLRASEECVEDLARLDALG